MKFSFNRGVWENGNPLSDWQENEQFDQFLARIGYNIIATKFGNEGGSNIEIYDSSNDDSFYASICPSGGALYEVFIPDFPSLMMFIRDHASGFAAESTNFYQQQTLELLQKLFHAQHGHSAHEVCRTCDPFAWEQQQEARKKRQIEKAAKSNKGQI